MSEPQPSFKYTGATPGADTTERDVFNTVTAFGYNSIASPGALARAGLKRLLVFSSTTATTGAIYLKFYYSADKGVTWVQDTDKAISPAAGVNQSDFKCEDVAHWDCKITATNQAATAQTTYDILTTGIIDRTVAV